MDVFEKLDALKVRFRAILGPRIESLIDSANQITLHSDQAEIHTYLEGIYTEAHNLASSAKPFGYEGISDIATQLQSVTLDVLSSEPTSNDERLLIIKVTDHGIGIPKEKLISVTEPFSRHVADPHKAYNGIGLGLAITKSLVVQHDGELSIESELDLGTTVTVLLPGNA